MSIFLFSFDSFSFSIFWWFCLFWLALFNWSACQVEYVWYFYSIFWILFQDLSYVFSWQRLFFWYLCSIEYGPCVHGYFWAHFVIPCDFFIVCVDRADDKTTSSTPPPFTQTPPPPQSLPLHIVHAVRAPCSQRPSSYRAPPQSAPPYASPLRSPHAPSIKLKLASLNRGYWRSQTVVWEQFARP